MSDNVLNAWSTSAHQSLLPLDFIVQRKNYYLSFPDTIIMDWAKYFQNPCNRLAVSMTSE